MLSCASADQIKVDDCLSKGHAAGAGPASPDYAWTYDEVGNMTSRSEGANTVAYSYNDSSHVHAVTGLSDGLSFVYDAVGNMTSRDHEDTTYLQKFDVENRLVAITDTQTLSVTQFVYDGEGNRVKTVYPDGSWTAFIGEHYEVDSDGKTRSYYFLGAQRIAMRIDYGESDVLYFFHTDHLGSTSLLSDENGAYVAGTEARYLPYGDYRIEPTADLTDHGFTGHKQQDEVGLICMRARFYAPGLGRFLSADTIVVNPTNPQKLNRYTYVSNNPLRYVDPSGHLALGENNESDYFLTMCLLNPELEAEFYQDNDNEPIPPAVDFGLRVLSNEYDMYKTAEKWSKGDLSWWGLDVLSFLPFIPGGLGTIVRKVDDANDLINPLIKVTKAVGQKHHILSNKIIQALNNHKVLKQVLKRNEFIAKALDINCHKGYQTWHRIYDANVVEWLKTNPKASEEDFLKYLIEVYSTEDLIKRFPEAVGIHTKELDKIKVVE